MIPHTRQQWRVFYFGYPIHISEKRGETLSHASFSS